MADSVSQARTVNAGPCSNAVVDMRWNSEGLTQHLRSIVSIGDGRAEAPVSLTFYIGIAPLLLGMGRRSQARRQF